MPAKIILGPPGTGKTEYLLKRVEEELANGTNLNSQDYDLRTAFHIAASTGQENVVRFFLESNASLCMHAME